MRRTVEDMPETPGLRLLQATGADRAMLDGTHCHPV